MLICLRSSRFGCILTGCKSLTKFYVNINLVHVCTRNVLDRICIITTFGILCTVMYEYMRHIGSVLFVNGRHRHGRRCRSTVRQKNQRNLTMLNSCLHRREQTKGQGNFRHKKRQRNAFFFSLLLFFYILGNVCRKYTINKLIYMNKTSLWSQTYVT